MGFHNESGLLDKTGWHLLRLLQQNARMTLRQLGDAVGLTAPAVGERVRRLEETGLISGYHAAVDLARAGLPIRAFVHLNSDSRQSARFRQAVGDMPEVMACHCVTGEESYILEVAVPSVPDLEHLLWRLKDCGEVRTSLVLSSQVVRRVVDRSAG